MTPVTSHIDYEYFVTFISDYSCSTWIYLSHLKDDVLSIFILFHTYIHTQNSIKTKILHSENEGSACLFYFKNHYKTNGIISQWSCPSTPRQNRVAERKNYHILNVVRTLLLESFVPA